MIPAIPLVAGGRLLLSCGQIERRIKRLYLQREIQSNWARRWLSVQFSSFGKVTLFSPHQLSKLAADQLTTPRLTRRRLAFRCIWLLHLVIGPARPLCPQFFNANKLPARAGVGLGLGTGTRLGAVSGSMSVSGLPSAKLILTVVR